MKYLFLFAIWCLWLVSPSQAQSIARDVPYGEQSEPLQRLDIYSPKDAGKLPVVFWIHGGGWETGDKANVQVKPQAFMDKGLVFVSTNYRLLPTVDMGTIIRDIAKSIHWVHDNIDRYGGDPKTLFIMGHSAGAQLAAIVCTDDRYLKSEGLALDIVKGCVPVDGDTYDVPAIITTAEIRNQVHGLPQPNRGHRVKFGSDPVKHIDFSAVTHIASGKGIPPFLILYVNGHPDTTAQAQTLGNSLTQAGIRNKVYGAKNTDHSKLNETLGISEEPTTQVLFDFVSQALPK